MKNMHCCRCKNTTKTNDICLVRVKPKHEKHNTKTPCNLSNCQQLLTNQNPRPPGLPPKNGSYKWCTCRPAACFHRHQPAGWLPFCAVRLPPVLKPQTSEGLRRWQRMPDLRCRMLLEHKDGILRKEGLKRLYNPHLGHQYIWLEGASPFTAINISVMQQSRESGGDRISRLDDISVTPSEILACQGKAAFQYNKHSLGMFRLFYLFVLGKVHKCQRSSRSEQT